MHGALGGLAILALIAFAFGKRTARIVVQIALLIAGVFALFVAFEIWEHLT